MDILSYLDEYYKDAQTITSSDLKAYTIWAVDTVRETILNRQDLQPIDILESLIRLFSEYAEYNTKSYYMFTCARDTMIDIYDHISYPRERAGEEYDCRLRLEK